jgi:hypothetical protein
MSGGYFDCAWCGQSNCSFGQPAGMLGPGQPVLPCSGAGCSWGSCYQPGAGGLDAQVLSALAGLSLNSAAPRRPLRLGYGDALYCVPGDERQPFVRIERRLPWAR